jgi:hypothetical protein
MSHQEALAILRSGKNGTDILNLLDKVSTLYSDVPDVDPELSDIEFDD